jgi:hypothetical protein
MRKLFFNHMNLDFMEQAIQINGGITDQRTLDELERAARDPETGGNSVFVLQAIKNLRTQLSKNTPDQIQANQ